MYIYSFISPGTDWLNSLVVSLVTAVPLHNPTTAIQNMPTKTNIISSFLHSLTDASPLMIGSYTSHLPYTYIWLISSSI